MKERNAKNFDLGHTGRYKLKQFIEKYASGLCVRNYLKKIGMNLDYLFLWQFFTMFLLQNKRC